MAWTEGYKGPPTPTGTVQVVKLVKRLVAGPGRVVQTLQLDAGASAKEVCNQLAQSLKAVPRRVCLLARSAHGPAVILGDDLPARQATGAVVLRTLDSRDAVEGATTPAIAKWKVLQTVQELLRRTRSYGGARPLPMNVLSTLQKAGAGLCGFSEDLNGIVSFLQALDNYFDDDEVLAAVMPFHDEFGLPAMAFDFEAAGAKESGEP